MIFNNQRIWFILTTEVMCTYINLYVIMSFLCTFGSSLTLLDCSFYVSFFKFTYIHKFCRWGKEQCDIHTKNVGNCVRWLLKLFRPNINMYLKPIQIDEVKPSIFIYFFYIKMLIFTCFNQYSRLCVAKLQQLCKMLIR